MERIHQHRRNANETGHAHELTFSCYRRFRFMAAERTCRWLGEAIVNARRQHGFELWAYVFMPEHVHMIVFPTRCDDDIADIRKAFKEPVAREAMKYLEQIDSDWLPRVTRRRRSRTERLFWQSGGGYDRNLYTVKALLAAIDYIHLNPVRRGLVEKASDWKWSSAAWFEGGISPIPMDTVRPEWLDMDS